MLALSLSSTSKHDKHERSPVSDHTASGQHNFTKKVKHFETKLCDVLILNLVKIWSSPKYLGGEGFKWFNRSNRYITNYSTMMNVQEIAKETCVTTCINCMYTWLLFLIVTFGLQEQFDSFLLNRPRWRTNEQTPLKDIQKQTLQNYSTNLNFLYWLFHQRWQGKEG